MTRRNLKVWALLKALVGRGVNSRRASSLQHKDQERDGVAPRLRNLRPFNKWRISGLNWPVGTSLWSQNEAGYTSSA